MHALALAILLGAQPDETVGRVKLDALTLEDAERLDGKAVVTTFTVGEPCSTWGAGKSLRTVTCRGGRGRRADRRPQG